MEKKENRIQIEPSLKAVDEEFHEERNEQCHEDSLSNDYRTYDVLRIIFRYLNYKDLSNAMMTCRTWLEAANHEKCSRGPLCSNIVIDLCGFTENIVFDLDIKPFIGLFFLFIDSYYHVECIIDYISKLLPRNCKIIMLFTLNVILNEEVILTNNITADVSLPNVDVISALLPQISNVKLSMITITDTTSEDKFTEYTQMIEKAMRQNHEISTCLMLFCNDNGKSIGRRMAELAHLRLNNNERKVSLYGGVVENIYISDGETVSPSESPNCVAFFITGYIRTWSIVLEDDLTVELVREKLKLFQEQVKLQRHSVGFVLSSHMRRAIHKLPIDGPHNEFYTIYRTILKNHDLTIFKELFPKVPLLGYGISDYLQVRNMFIFPSVEEWPYFATFIILTYD